MSSSLPEQSPSPEQSPPSSSSSPEQSSSSSPEQSGWQSLCEELLELIGEKFDDDADYSNYRAVCTNWRDSAPPRHHLPWIIASFLNRNSSYTYEFFTLSECVGQMSPVSRLPSLLLLKSTCIGSSLGWMALRGYNDASSITLLHPLTGATVLLPPLPGAMKLILSSDPTTKGCVAMVHHRGPTPFSFSICRPGDDAWLLMDIPTNFGGWQVDFIFYNGRFIATDTDYAFAIIDIKHNPPKIQLVSPLSSSLPDVGDIYLVESSGDLLAITRRQYSYSATYRFNVYKLNWVREGVRLLSEVTIQDKVIFLGLNQAISLPASVVPWCNGGCIYFAEYHRAGGMAIGVYNLDHGQMECQCSAHLPERWAPIAWLYCP